MKKLFWPALAIAAAVVVGASGACAQIKGRLIEWLELATRQTIVDVGNRAFDLRGRPCQQQAERQAEAHGDEHGRPVGFAVPVLQGAAFEADRRTDRVTRGCIGEADDVR